MVKKRQGSTPNGETCRNVPYGCGLSDAPLAVATLLTTSASVGFRSFNNVGASFDCNASDDADALGGLKDFNDVGARLRLSLARKRPPASIFIHYSQSTASNPCPISIRHRQLTASIGHSPPQKKHKTPVRFKALAFCLR